MLQAPNFATARPLLPGILLAAAVAIAGLAIEWGMRRATGGFAIPAMVAALLIGMALSPVAAGHTYEPGLTWCVKKLLRIAIALLGIRIALADIAGLGFGVAALVMLAMAATLLGAIALSRWLGLGDGYGALAGAATAICGASATLATATVVPAYPAKSADVAFTVVAANAVSTLVMLLYPPLAVAIGYGAQETGILLGATIHDMAQVVGAGYATSEPVGNTAVIVKLFRVALLLPVVLAIGWWFAARGPVAVEGAGRARVPVPVFALGFLALCLLNSAASALPAFAPLYGPLKGTLVALSNVGLLLAISALGLGTSLKSILTIGWRHALVFTAATLLILAIVAAGLSAGPG
jgi:uncharacterized integral membrane protein (TIGR00698 family)